MYQGVNVFLFILFSLSFSFGQDLKLDVDNSPFELSEGELYNWVYTYNQNNLLSDDYYKTEKTHRLDSIHSILLANFGDNPFHFVFVFDLEDENREISYLYRGEPGSNKRPLSVGTSYYNEDGNLTLSHSADWDGNYDNTTEEFANKFVTYEYNQEGLLTEVHSKDRDQYVNKLPASRVSYMYNDNDLVTNVRSESWSADADSFAISREIVIGYKDDLVDYIVTYRKDDQRGFYANDSTAYFYNDKNLLVREMRHGVIIGTTELVHSVNFFIEYNENDKRSRTERHIGFRTSEDGLPTNIDSTLYGYHDYDDLAYTSRGYTDSLPNYVIYKESSRKEYEHDHQVGYNQIRRYKNFAKRFGENHMLLKYSRFGQDYRFEYGGDPYVNNLGLMDRDVFYYSEISTSDTDDIVAEINPYSLSPNPASDILQITSAHDKYLEITLQLTDMHGRQVLSQSTSPNEAVDVSHLESGVYIYQITEGDKVYSGKLVVE